MEHGLGTALPVRAHRQWTPLARALAAVGDHWTLLIVLALSNERLRLSVLRARLPGISSGVLDHHVAQMIARGLLSRERFREMPPRVEVQLTDRGAELLPIAAALARWGMRREWPLPESIARGHAEAILRQLPALLEDATALADGTVEAVVSAGTGNADVGGDGAKHRFAIAHGRLVGVAASGTQPTALVEGNEAAWTAALGPACDYSGLRFAGKRSVAKRMLEALPRELPSQ
jgi:DNA-binding HxlR family transcriptional regulator